MLMARSEYHRVFLLSPANSDAFANCVQSERPDFVLCGLYGGGNADRDDRRPRKARRSRKRERRSNNAGGPERGRLRGPVTEARTWRRACFTPLLLGALNPHWRPVFASAVWTGLRKGGTPAGEPSPACCPYPYCNFTCETTRPGYVSPEARAVLVRRLLFSFSRSCCPPAATTRSRPLSFASYKAASALSISDSGVSPWLGHSATPMLIVILPPANSSIATRARIRSATIAAVPTVVSSSITKNSSPPYRATQSTPRVVFRRMSAILASAASPAGWPFVSLYSLICSTSANSTENGRRSR